MVSYEDGSYAICFLSQKEASFQQESSILQYNKNDYFKAYEVNFDGYERIKGIRQAKVW